MANFPGELGEPLPIFDYRQKILDAVNKHQVTIITAETGAGKSTQVPQYLAEHGYRKVIVTQPRIIAARNLCARVREEMAIKTGKDSDQIVGYRTAHERDDDPENTILYCTDGLQLVRELTGSGIGDEQILVLDEIHEWNENMEVLIAWSKQRCQKDPNFKVVIMSATIEAEKVAGYFGGATTVAVPGRSFPVKKLYRPNLVSEIIGLIEKGSSNTLVFLPGKAEIENVAEAVKQKAADRSIPIIPLHGQLEPIVQQRAFASYPGGKLVLSTNVAQTSITVSDIDVVIDSGLERRSEIRSGVEGLFIAEVSKADCLQRAGRAGRTKPGTYILAQLDDLPCAPLDKRPEYGEPEILRKHIDRLVLRLANIGIDIEDLDFYHSPKPGAIKRAKSKLITLGALTRDGRVTPIGHAMERFPVESSYGRMLVEAASSPPKTKAKLAAIIAIQEVGGIVKNGSRYTGWRRFTGQTRSDLLAQYDVYLALDNIDPLDFEETGIIAKNVSKAEEVRVRLLADLGLDDTEPQPVTPDEIEPLLRAIVAGQLDQLWSVAASGEVVHIGTDKQRELSSGTLVRQASIVAATPFDLEIPTPKGLKTLHIVTDVTMVNPDWLETLAPHLFEVTPGKIYYDPRLGALATGRRLIFNGQRLETTGAPITENTPENQRLFIKLYSIWAHSQLERERDVLQKTSSRRVPKIPLHHVQKQVATRADHTISLAELPKNQRHELSKLAHLDAYLGDKVMSRLRSSSRRTPHQRRKYSKGWRPHKQKYSRREKY